MEGVVQSFIFVQETFFSVMQEHSRSLQATAIAVATLFFLYWIFVRPYIFFKRLGIPQVKPFHPLLGNIPEINKGSTKMRMRCMKDYGSIFGYYVGRRPVIDVTDAKMLEQVFVKMFGNFHNRPSFFGKKKPPMHLGILIAEYRDWRRIRLTLNPTFSAGKIKQMLPLMEEAVDTLLSLLLENSKKEQVTDVYRYYSRLTMDVILSVAFGLKTDFQLKKNEKITKEAMSWFTLDRRAFLIDMLPLPLSIRQWLRLFLSPDPAFFVNLLKPVIEERRKTPSSRKDFLQLLLSENKEDGKLKLSDDDIYAQAITFLLAGYETTSNALAYTTYLLALHPYVQQRLYEEIVEKFDNDPNGSVYDDIQKMEYLDQVLNESLRVYPPVYQTARLTEEECEVNGYRIPEGIVVNIPIYAIHHYEEYWKDHDKFDPERFNAENKPKINPYHYLPFGAGPRNCVGMRFALIEAKLALVKVLKKIKFVQVPETEIPLSMSYGISMTPINGIKVGIVQRE